MICPNCNAEYREGFSVCADCNVPLVRPDEVQDEEELLDPGEEADVALITILDTADAISLNDAVCALEDQGIPYVVHSGTALGLKPGDSGDLVWRAILAVPKSFVKPVEELLQQIHDRKRGNPARPAAEPD